MTPAQYRERAILQAARLAARPATMELTCGTGCGVRTEAISVPESPTATAILLATRALRDGWDLDPVGILACPACVARLAARLATEGTGT